MWNLLCFLTCLVVVAVGVSAVDTCPENNRQYSIAPGGTRYGRISSPSGAACKGASLEVLSPPASPSLLLLVGGWNYLFGAVVDAPLPAAVEFALSARCDGVEVCRASLRYEVDANASSDDSATPDDPSTTTTTTTTTIAPKFPPCAASRGELQLRMLPGRTNVARLPTSAVQMVCPGGLRASITQPEIGSAAVLSPNSLQFIYASPQDDIEANVTLPYEVKCDENVVCAGVMQIWLHETVSQCPKNHLVYDVKPGAQLNATLATGAACDGVLRARLRTQALAHTFKFYDGVSFTFNAPSKEEDVTLDARLYCDDEALCDVTFAVVVTNQPRPSSTEAPAPAPTAAPVVMCKEQFNFTVPVATELRGNLHVDVAGCSFVTYHQPLYSSCENLQLNIIGDFLYSAPAKEGIDKLPVDVSCIKDFRCRTHIMITSYIDLTPTQSPTTPPITTAAPVLACANVYYYQTVPGAALSDSLNGVPGQDPCAYGRYFSMIYPPDAGTLELTHSGDFLYRPERHEGAYHFSFSMYCLNTLYCRGNAYILVSNEWTLPPSGSENGTTAAPTPSVVKNKQIKCRGTCNEKAWKTYPKPAMWDNTPGAGYARRDGRAVDGIQVAWMKNSIVITVYTIIGNLGVRFPTFEPLNPTVGKYFEPNEFEGVVAPTSPGFELSCLANQGSIGMGEDVWRWKTLGNGSGTGSVGALYNKGTSWYQKFGGKHIGCDTFVDSCLYAPLLTPAVPNVTAAAVRWELEIDDCDATWTGTFPYATLEKLKKSDGSPVWYFVGDKQVKGTILSEGVRANSWIEPARSFDAQYEAHDVFFDLQQFVVVKKLTPTTPFSIDSEFFEYTENGDRAFGVNLLLHPYVTEDMETSYAEDRHVVGFKWIAQDWIAPSAEQCTTCKGNRSHCKDEEKYGTPTYTGEFPSGDCPPGTGLVELRKGPAMDVTACPPSRMHVFNRSGFSLPTGCATWYQNLTIRGVSLGSGALPDALQRTFSYEGRVLLQLLMTDGTKHDVAMELSIYVTRLSQGSHAAAGRLSVCRGSDYWPVLDPLGVSLPDRPFELSSATPGPLCIDTLSSTFGPSGWATVFLQIPGVSTSQVNVHSILLKYKNTSVFLHYQDPRTGAVLIPPRTVGYWWQHTHPFLSFRQLINKVANDTLTIGPGVSPSEVTDVSFAFAFIPGSINIATDVEILLTATISTEVVRTSTFYRTIHVDPMMTQRSRYGPPRKGGRDERNAIRENALEVGALAALSIAVTVTGVVYMTMDNNRPLPKWVPRGKLIKNTVLAAVPAGLRPAKKAKKIVHKDMYDAMKSGRY
ncbi:uncharacterized protein Tco025E_05970 [Trypanosoma conorhini]|uniref:Uncharacterized protein n=1 Tax=Trypanosoma conorhini TaxID=83891 RepID=A0A3R7LGL4_9TRYP|nr:uncharacterized protein Tco025E_05970 [Trypanosoma conorhini]RNF13994.1 hypothetical protein Tco025E_05970 [Trypanosoma conorhini]